MTRSAPPLATLALIVATAACHRTASAPTAAPAAGTAAAAVSGAAAAPDARLVTQGDSIYAAISCSRCHGASGEGTATAPSLVAGPWLHVDGSAASIAAIIVSGVPREALKGEGRTRAMNPRGGPANLTDEQVQAVAAYVFTISRAKR